MSLDISGSKYVRVYNPTIRLKYSDKVIFADLVTSRKTGIMKVDKKTGEVLRNPVSGLEIQERAFSRWEGRFVGNAVEAAKGIADGDPIDIISGWATAEAYVGKDQKEHRKTVLFVAEFVPSEVAEGEDTDQEEEE